MPTMIYHAPFPLNRQAKAASGIRPVRMYDAFVSLGYEVIDITGRAAQRRSAIKTLKQRLRAGLVVDFLYSESATIPTMLTEPRHIPPHPFVDPALFKLCRQHKIPTGLFYRDMYWAFDGYLETVSRPIATIMRSLYRYDLRWYSKYVSRLYVPSLLMGQEIEGYPYSQMKALPPGSQIKDFEQTPREHAIELLYVGGMGDHYRVHTLFEAVSRLTQVGLTVCTHENQWQAVADQYLPMLTENIRIVHESGEGLLPLYAQADIACLYVEPDSYRTFAAPVKLFEYIGYGKPVLSTEGTLAAEMIKDSSAGWVIPYDTDALCTLLEGLLEDPSRISAVSQSVREVRTSHSWEARACFVAEDLGSLR